MSRRGGALLLPCCVPLLFPLDAPWINDEPLLLALALKAYKAGRLVAMGLEGNHRVHYGRFPI
jgi:hypothetical protein